MDWNGLPGTARPPPAPLLDLPLVAWRAWLTRYLEVRRSGVVFFHLALPSRQTGDHGRIKRAISALFEARWYQLRRCSPHMAW